MNTTIPRRRAVALIALPVSAALLLAGCSGGGGSANDVGAGDIESVTDDDLQGTEIQFSRVFGDCDDTTKGVTDISQATSECEDISILTNIFNAENEYGITVDRVGTTDSASYYDALNAAMAGGDAPDVALMHASSLPQYAERNLLLPLDDVIDITGVDLADAAATAAGGVQFDGESYAVPFDQHAILAHVNLDLFEQAGLLGPDGRPVMPTSTEEFLSQAQQVKDATGKDYIAIPRVNDGMAVNVLMSLMAQQGVTVLNEEGTESQVDSPEAREALEFMDEIYAGGYADTDATYDSAQQSFLDGNTAMLVNGTWVVNQYNADATFDYEATDFPTLFDNPGVWSDSHTWAIPRQQEADPVKYRAALEFLSFLYDRQADWAVGTGHLAARTSVLESPAYQQAPERANYAETGLTNTFQVPHISKWPAVSSVFAESAQSIWFQDAEVDEALADADQRINSALE